MLKNLSQRTRFLSKVSKEFSSDSFMTGNSAIYVEQMYQKWLENRGSVHASWDAYFSNVPIDESVPTEIVDSRIKKNISGVQSDNSYYSNVLRLFLLIRSFRNRGHAIADLDPLSNTQSFLLV